MRTFEIYFTDLTAEAQERFLQEIDVNNENNFDTFPIATVDFESEV